ncbi:MAG: hypothetical protein HY901_32785 [Deltaproteobacteria bacterium]|nr:hypothetical protein [Deltaproteobacteria bacterium]
MTRIAAPRALAVVLALLLLSPEARAQEGQGFAELRGAWLVGTSGKQWQLVERVRPTFSVSFSERIKLVGTIEGGLAQGRATSDELQRALEDGGFGPLLAQAGCNWPEPTNSVLRIDRASDYLEVVRLYLDYFVERLDVHAGRQALHWGSGQFFNPTDPFPEVLLSEPWRPRRGVNALRAHFAFTGLTDATAVAALDDSLTKPRAALRLRTNHWGVDSALTGAWRGGSDWLAGVDLRGTLGVGFWLEAALRFSGQRVHEELAAGIDYSFPVLERLVVAAQYYRNGAGETDPDRYSRLAGIWGGAGPVCSGGASPLGSTAQSDPFAPTTLARDYLLLSVAAQVLPELSLNLPLLQNLNDGTAVVIPTVSWSATDWLDLSLSGQIPFATWGRGGELKPRAGDLAFERDLGAAGIVRADLSGLVPAATLTFWTRASF